MLSAFRFFVFGCFIAVIVQTAYAEPKTFFNPALSFGKGSSQNNDSGLYGDFLPPEQAFIYSVETVNQQQVRLLWVIADGYYLYKDKFIFSTDADVKFEQTIFPNGVFVDDPKYGAVEVFKGEVAIQLILDQSLRDRELMLNFSYQGCAEGGLCYPLMHSDYPLMFNMDLKSYESAPVQANNNKEKQISVTANKEVIAQDKAYKVEVEPELFSQEGITAALAGNGFVLNLVLFFVAGIISAFLGCSYPLIPIVSSLIAGQGERITPLRGASLSFVYVVAMALALSLVGLVAATVGVNVTALLQNPYVLGGFSLIFVVLALAMFGKLSVATPAVLTNYFNNLSNKQNGGSYIGAAIMGALSALIAGPCATPVLAGALIYIAQSNDILLGWAALFALGLGTGVPLIVVGAGMGSFLPKAGDWMDLVKGFFGFVLLGLALWFLAQGGVPVRVVNAVWGILFVSAGIYFIRKAKNILKETKIINLFAIVLIGVGVISVAGAVYGGKNLTHPFTRPLVSEFTYVISAEELQQRIAGDKPVVIYFSAEWCVVCRHLEANVLSESKVVSALQSWNPTKVDLTDIGDFQQELMDKYQIIGPPTFVFLARDGNILKRIVGNVDKDRLLQDLQQ